MEGLPDSGSFHAFGSSSILTWLQADTGSHACPAHPGSLEITFRTLATVIFDADALLDELPFRAQVLDTTISMASA